MIARVEHTFSSNYGRKQSSQRNLTAGVMPSVMQRHCIFLFHISVLTHPVVNKPLQYSSSVYACESFWTGQRRQQTSPFTLYSTLFPALHLRSSISGQLCSKIAHPTPLNSCRYSYPFHIEIHIHGVEGSRFQRRTHYARSPTIRTLFKACFWEQNYRGNVVGRTHIGCLPSGIVGLYI